MPRVSEPAVPRKSYSIDSDGIGSTRSPVVILLICGFLSLTDCASLLASLDQTQLDSEELRLDLPAILTTGDLQDSSPKTLRELLDEEDTFRPGEPWLDHSGNLIQAHGGGLLFHEGIYYWFGEYKAGPTYTKQSRAYSPPRVDVIGVSCYSSTNLLHWYFEGLALKGGTHRDLHYSMVLERPKVLYHRHLNKFVMWMHIDTGDYEWARLGIATSETVIGPYKFLRSFRPHNQQARDFAVFQDVDEIAYLAYSSEDNSVMHVAKLREDYLGVQAAYNRILMHLKREAPAIFRYKEYYLMLTSGCTGWEPNRAEIFYSRDIMGNWTSLGNPSAGGESMDRAYTFWAQPSFVLPLHGQEGRFIQIADQWDEGNLGASRYVWLPMWIRELPAGECSREYESWEALRTSNGWTRPTFSAPPAPIHVVVPWLQEWKPSILNKDIDPQIRDEHMAELRNYTSQ